MLFCSLLVTPRLLHCISVVQWQRETQTSTARSKMKAASVSIPCLRAQGSAPCWAFWASKRAPHDLHTAVLYASSTPRFRRLRRLQCRSASSCIVQRRCLQLGGGRRSSAVRSIWFCRMLRKLYLLTTRSQGGWHVGCLPRPSKGGCGVEDRRCAPRSSFRATRRCNSKIGLGLSTKDWRS